MQHKYGLNPKKHKEGRRKSQPHWRKAVVTHKEVFQRDSKGNYHKAIVAV